MISVGIEALVLGLSYDALRRRSASNAERDNPHIDRTYCL